MKGTKKILVLSLIFVFAFSSIVSAANPVTKEELTASEMLQKASEKINEYKTYKVFAEINQDAKVTIPMLAEQTAKTMMRYEEYVDNRGKSLEKTTIVSDELTQGKPIITETFTNGNIRYIKNQETGKWTVEEIDLFNDSINSLMESNPQQYLQFADFAILALDVEAKYMEDKRIAGQDYYVINMKIEKDKFKEIMKLVAKEDLKKSIIAVQETTGQMSPQQELQYQEQLRMIEQMVDQMMASLEIEADYTYYVNKTTKEFFKLELVATVNSDVSLKEMMGEESDGLNINEDLLMHLENSTKADYCFYGFDQEITFPEIKLEDLQ